MYDKYIEKIDRLNEQGRRLALQCWTIYCPTRKIVRTTKVRDRSFCVKRTRF